MFSSPTVLLPVLTVLLCGISLAIAFFSVESAARGYEFWYVMLGILLAEVSLGFSFMDIGGNHGDRAYLYRLGNVMTGIVYMAFSLLMLIPYAMDASATLLLSLELLGLFAALVLHVCFGWANHATAAQDRLDRGSFLVRKKSKLDLQALYSDHEEFFTDNRELGKSCRELLDTAACASDSVSGSEEVDAELQSNIMMLRGSVEAADAEATAKQIRRLLAIYNKRQALIRELR